MAWPQERAVEVVIVVADQNNFRGAKTNQKRGWASFRSKRSAASFSYRIILLAVAARVNLSNSH
jgi:hypothetical protein